MKVDNLYIENLTEYVMDDGLFVTYKFLSMKLGVHVNLAKQMLFHFYDMQKAKGKKIFATYYLSGIAPQKWISSINSSKEDLSSPDDEEEDSSQNDQDAYLVLLCKDHELEEFKKKFTRLYSVHVYGLSRSPLTSYDVLNRALEQPLRDDEGRAPVHFGPITCKAAFEYRENPRLAPLLKSVQEVKEKVGKAKESHEKKQEKDVKKEFQDTSTKGKNVGVTSSSNKSDDTVETSKNRLKNMFAAAASKPKPKEIEQPKKAEIVKKNSKTSSKEEESQKSAVGKSKSSYKQKESSRRKEKANQNRKRKRIKDVFSSSSDEESDSTKKSDDEEGLPESPIPRKRIQIESDSDDDFKKETPKKREPVQTKTVEKTSSSGKRRVCKSVPQTHVDDEGFLVTTIVQEMVSESDEEKESKNKDEKMETEQQRIKSKENISSAVPARNVKKKPDQPSVVAGKKQASIMSFFQKK